MSCNATSLSFAKWCSLETLPRATEADVEIGSKLKKLRTLKGISQTAIADQLDLTFQQLQKYERGTNRISAVNLHKLSKILEVPMTAFFEEEKAIKDLEFDNQTKRLFRFWSSASEKEKDNLLKMIKFLS